MFDIIIVNVAQTTAKPFHNYICMQFVDERVKMKGKHTHTLFVLHVQ